MADRLLSTLLRSLQTYTDQQDTPRILGTASSLLTTLGNPHNLSLLTAHILTAPALWDRSDGVQTPLRLLSVFHTAVTTVVEYHSHVRTDKAPELLLGQTPIGGGLPLDDWIRAVVGGADERSQRWKHLITLGGLLIGIASLERQGLDLYWTSGMRKRLEGALVRAVNLALVEVRERSEADGLGGQTIALVLNHAFACIADTEKAHINYDLLLPVLIGTAFFSNEGFQSAYFLGGLDLDVAVKGGRLNWDARSTSYRQVEAIMARPLAASMGPLSRLIAHAVENVSDPWLIQTMMDDLASFARALTTQWRQVKFSEIDPAEEEATLSEEAYHRTLPLLWKLLKSALFATTVVLRGVFNRTLADSSLASDVVAPALASQALQTLRHMYFITTRLEERGHFSQHTFVYLTAIDVLAAYPLHADKFLKSIAPQQLGQIPRHPLDRILDLYFLNAAEHFTLVLSPAMNEDLLVASAVPYLAAGGNHNMLPIFESAHNVMLAVLSAPQSAEITAKHLPFYIDALFSVFPDNLSPRQFRLAFKTLMRVTAPPSALSATHPDLPATLLELVHFRALNAPTQPLPPDDITLALQSSDVPPPLFSEQAVLVLTLVDALPYLPIPLLEEWLPLCADLLNRIDDDVMRDAVKARYWEVLVSGEMDPARSSCCVAWWGTKGGRESVLYGRENGFGNKMMSGALPAATPLRESKL
ncbi:hypothetical protein P280DRAFT_523778 [Massarina eburnea CBS 473.64]|uniref:Peroxisomal membrane protein Pex17 n=1 Tax=Massarina eburnea CBS 473.64 TaxID=1395130 RepID=A0A6A6RH34_9PLEO|nr:hypothetical protein P280DRAFT_523778 [Massarina eburnea CBS 473.64]